MQKAGFPLKGAEVTESFKNLSRSIRLGTDLEVDKNGKGEATR